MARSVLPEVEEICSPLVLTAIPIPSPRLPTLPPTPPVAVRLTFLMTRLSMCMALFEVVRGVL